MQAGPDELITQRKLTDCSAFAHRFSQTIHTALPWSWTGAKGPPTQLCNEQQARQQSGKGPNFTSTYGPGQLFDS